jgi:hypothetical protein
MLLALAAQAIHLELRGLAPLIERLESCHIELKAAARQIGGDRFGLSSQESCIEHVSVDP